ncbi:rod shape-determining protein MreC [Desulfocucumis palustris]|uniref:rod shape-determining protein MreC n=1 Tax=Desulfocucumis palustris TaxID=1898651 RepID=UPI0013FDFC57|nr:rod shape-determining protein MreC [Desulfocucumis palustris]
MPRRIAYKRIFLLAVLVLLTLALVKYTAYGRLSVSPVEAALRDALSPVQGLATQVGHRLKGLVSFPFDVVGMTRRNHELSENLKKAEGQLRQLEEYRLENQRLQKLLDFHSNTAQAMGFELTNAAVISRDPGNWFGMLRINKGSDQGIQKNMTVLSPEGLVGRISSVSADTAEVLLITDPRSGVGALIQENRTPGLVEGVSPATGQIRMVHIPTGALVKKNQVVITAGMGSLYLKGIPVGTVSTVGRESSGLFKSATLVPFVDFDRLEEVMVITSSGAPGSKVSLADIPPPWGQAEKSGGSPGTVRAGESASDGKAPVKETSAEKNGGGQPAT